MVGMAERCAPESRKSRHSVTLRAHCKRLPTQCLRGNLNRITRILRTQFQGETLPVRNFSAPCNSRRALSFAARLLAALVLLSTAGCDDDFLFYPASSTNYMARYTVYSLSGSSGTLPAAFSLRTSTVERPQVLTTGEPNFDFAFDLDPNGAVTLIPVISIVPLPPAGASSVSFRMSDVSFDELTRAPDKGYVDDTAITAQVGETVLIRLNNAGCYYGEPFYAKIIIDYVDVSMQMIGFRALVDRNCGFRSLTEGLPDN